MNKFSYVAALLSLCAAPAAIAKEAPNSFKHDGVTYKYTVKNISENKRVITGYATPGASFSLVVYNDKVSGTANGMPVSFKMKDVTVRTATARDVTVASR